MIRIALDSFSDRDLARAESLVELDELVDRANRRVVERILELGEAAAMREYGLRMVLVSRALERIGDHAVDIGEQIAYLLTGEFREFTDASHPARGSLTRWSHRRHAKEAGLTLALDEMFEKRLQQAEVDVAREFATLDRDVVHREFERVAGDLLRNATVTDFVPVLARRHAREQPAVDARGRPRGHLTGPH